MASYNFTVVHRSGKLNANADALSRRADYQEGETVKVKRALFSEQDGKLVHQIATLTQRDESWQRIQAAQKYIPLLIFKTANFHVSNN